ncbi:MAG: ATP-binding protein [Lysobacterales bacterium]
MTLRRQLLVFVLVLAVLPVVAWQSARQVESFLRESRAQAQLASTSALAASLDLSLLPTFGEFDLYLNPIDPPVQVDGYAGDWQIWLDYQQVFDGRQDRFSVALSLASWQRNVYALINVRDASSQRASERAGVYQPGDHLQINLRDLRGFTRYRLLPSVPGSFTLLPLGAGANSSQSAINPLPPPVQGSWRETSSGYQVELQLPRALLGDTLDLGAIDTGQGLGDPQIVTTAPSAEASRLIEVNNTLMGELSALVAKGSRAWILHPQGWVLAYAGNLGSVSGEAPTGWQRLAYRLLAGHTLEQTASRGSAVDLQLSGPEILAAKQGRASVSWRRVSAGKVEASAAMPLGNSGAILVLEQPADPLLLATNQSALRLLGLTLLVVAIVVLGLLAHNTWLSIRIRRLRDASEQALSRFAAADEVPLPGTSASDEIGDLARSFSGLFAELRSYNHYLKTLASKLSHELNTPLAVVRSSLENLKHEALSEQAQTFALRADEGAGRLRNILSAMSEASRLEHSLEQAEALEFDFTDVISGCVDGYRSVYTHCQWQVQLPDAAMMKGAPELLAQMLDKLADNAAGFCPARGQVTLTLSRLGKGWRLVFGNDGPLLPEQLKEQIFDSLVSSRGEDTDQPHLGLGLHIVRLIVRAHGGRISARNRSDDTGVEFVMNLFGVVSNNPAS